MIIIVLRSIMKLDISLTSCFSSLLVVAAPVAAVLGSQRPPFSCR